MAEKKSTLLSLFDLEKIGRELVTALQTAEPSEGVTVVLHEKVREIIDKHRELIDEDYEALFAELMRDRGEFRVGSAEGHATEVTIRDNTIRIRYYDYDHDVNHYIRQDFEECGLTCKELDDGVECEGTYTGEEQLKCIASTMAEATSMDIRLRGY